MSHPRRRRTRSGCCHHAGRALLTLTLTLGSAILQANETRALIAAGLGGNAEYESEFRRHADRLRDGLDAVTDDVTLLTGEAAGTDAIRAALSALAGRLDPDDTLLFAYVGHGSWDGEHFRFNVPGRDFTAADLADWLADAPAENQIVIVTGASSGAVQDALAAENRTIITGTRSGEQRNATVFGRYFTAALEDAAADVDKDSRVTAMEAFRFARARIEQHYGREGEMATEHPLASGPDPVLVLALLGDKPATRTEDAGLIARRDELELDIANLKSRKDQLSQDDYFAELQQLLLEMAVIEAQLSGEGNETP